MIAAKLDGEKTEAGGKGGHAGDRAGAEAAEIQQRIEPRRKRERGQHAKQVRASGQPVNRAHHERRTGMRMRR